MKLTLDKLLWIPGGDTYRYWSGSYEQKQFEFMRRCLIETRVALDIGAHVGLWSQRLSPVFNEVIAFEPVPAHIECFHKNCEGLQNVKIHEVAISDEVGRQGMKVVSQGNTGMSALNKRIYGVKTDSVLVKVQTLDSYNLQNVDFIKMDIEGNEVKALQGSIGLLKRCRPLIFIEDHYHTSKKKDSDSSIDYLRSMGYRSLGLPYDVSGYDFSDGGHHNYLMGYEGWQQHYQ